MDKIVESQPTAKKSDKPELLIDTLIAEKARKLFMGQTEQVGYNSEINETGLKPNETFEHKSKLAILEAKTEYYKAHKGNQVHEISYWTVIPDGTVPDSEKCEINFTDFVHRFIPGKNWSKYI